MGEKDIQFYFDPKGIEEVVPTDMISIKGGYSYSTILDFDGFIHKGINDIGIQYYPNMGSTGVFAACMQNPNIMLRISDKEDLGYYSEDGGITWEERESVGGFGGGKGAITSLGYDKYRFFHASSNKIMYSDDYGKSWQNSTSIFGENFNILVEETEPMIAYYYSYLKKQN